MKLWILGNGFDLAHDLPTSYEDYHSYLLKQNEKWLVGMLEYYFGNDVHSSKNYLWSQLEKALGIYDVKAIYDFLKEGHSMDLDHVSRFVGEVEAEVQYHFVGICDKFNETFAGWCEQIILEGIKPLEKFCFSSSDIFLTFNYTDTLERVYGIDENQVLHIHGRASKGEELIVGHNNHARIPYGIKDDFLDNTANYRAIVETINRLEKKSKKIITENCSFFNGLGSVDEVSVYGHSIEEVDIGYFEEIRRNVDVNAHWCFYCYDKSRKKHYDDMAMWLGIGPGMYDVVIG